MRRKSNKRFLESLERRDLLSINAVLGAQEFDGSSEFRFAHVTLGKLFVEVDREVAVIDIESNTSRPLLDLTQGDFTIVDSSATTVRESNRRYNPLVRTNAEDTYLTTSDANGDFQLWITNGTETGTKQLLQSDTQILMDQTPTDDSYVSFFIDDETWITQGTVKTTKRVDDAGSLLLGQTTDAEGTESLLTFRFTDDAHELWLQNPDFPDNDRLLFAEPIATVVEPNHGPERSIHLHHTVGDHVYFSVDRLVGGVSTDELFVSNISSGNTESIVSPNSDWARARFNFGEFIDVGDRIMFQETGISASQNHVESRHWISGGTPDTTFPLSIEPNSDLLYSDGPQPQTIVIDKQVFYFSPEKGDLWTFDSDAIEPQLLWKNPAQDRVRMRQPASLGSELLIDALTAGPVSGYSKVVLRTDGTAEGTSVVDTIGETLVELADRVLTFDDTYVQLFEQGQPSSVLPLASPGERIVFVGEADNVAIVVVRANLGVQSQFKVYTTNGTQSGTFVIDSFETLRFPPSDFISTPDAGFFAGPFDESQRTLWRVDYDAIADINDDARLDSIDIDALATAIASNTTEPEFDINRDGKIDADDSSTLIQEFAETQHGDANLDRTVDFADFLKLAANFGRTDDVGWTEGDFDADGEVGQSDLDELIANFGFDRFA